MPFPGPRRPESLGLFGAVFCSRLLALCLKLSLEYDEGGKAGRTHGGTHGGTDGGCKRPPHLPATGAQSRCRPACAGPPASGRSRPCPAGAAGAARRCSGRSSRPPPPPGPAPPGSGKPARTGARGNTDPTHTGRAGKGPGSGPAVTLAVRFTSPNLSALLCFLFFVFLNF